MYIKPFDLEPDDMVRAFKKENWCRRIRVPETGRYAEVRKGIETYKRCLSEISPADQAGRYKNAIDRLKADLMSIGEACAVQSASDGFPDISMQDIFPDGESRERFREELSDAFFKTMSFDSFVSASATLAGLVRQRYAMRYAACLTETFEGRPYLPCPGLYWMGENRCWYGFNDAGEWVPDYRFPDLDVIEQLSKLPKARALLNITLAMQAEADRSVSEHSPLPAQEAVAEAS